MFCKPSTAIDLSERNIKVLLWKPSSKFLVANIGMIFMMAVEQEYDELNIKTFQDT
jgi:3-hydroxyacyl-CoA dehydrogenase